MSTQTICDHCAKTIATSDASGRKLHPYRVSAFVDDFAILHADACSQDCASALFASLPQRWQELYLKRAARE